MSVSTNILVENQISQMNAIEQAILRVIREHGGHELPFPLLLGTLRIIEHSLIKRAEAAVQNQPNLQ